MPDLITIFGSGFLFVTGAFDCADTSFAAVLDTDFAVGVAGTLSTGFADASVLVFAETLLSDFAAAARCDCTFTLPDGLADTAVFSSDPAFDLVDELTEAGFAFAGSVKVFADFFIAFAIESTTN